MPGGRRSANKPLAAARLAGGGTIAEAAADAGVDERTVYKWKADDPQFRARVCELRAEMVSRALGKLSDTMTRASDVLAALLASEDEDVRHRAAKAVIELALRVREQVDLDDRLAAVERALKGEGDGGDQGAAEATRGVGEEADSPER